MIDAMDRCILNNKTPKVAQDLIEEMAMNSYQWYSSQAKPSKLAKIYNVDAIIALVI